MSRRSGVAAGLLVARAALPAAGAAPDTGDRALAAGRSADPQTDVLSRPPGVLPKGIGGGPHRVFYVTSSANGALYRGHLGHRQMLLPAKSASRRSVLGVHTERAGREFIAGSTALDVYTPQGRLLAHRPAPVGPAGPASLNHLVITDNVVHVTDFADPVVLRAVGVPLNP